MDSEKNRETEEWVNEWMNGEGELDYRRLHRRLHHTHQNSKFSP